MGKINERVLALLEGSEIKYHMIGDGYESMSLPYFEENYDLLADNELPNIEQYSYYYQNKGNPDLVMYFKVCSTGLTATLVLYKDAQQRIEDIRNI